MQDYSRDIIELVIQRVLEDAGEVQELEHDLFNDGQRLAFSKIITAFEDAMLVFNEEPSDYGLTIDADSVI